MSPTGTERARARLSVTGIGKSFSGVDVLRGIDLDACEGEVVALLGENGAGKSTLSAIIAGSIRPSAGRMRFEGRPYAPASPREAIEAGIGLIQQESKLLPDLSIAENVFLGQLPMRQGRVDGAAMRAHARAHLLRLGLDVSPARLVRTLSVAARQQVEIAKALSRNVRLLILDEPTAALGANETQRLFMHLQQLKASGISFIYITHRLGEVSQIADRVLVLRDGDLVARHETADLKVATLTGDMVGRTIERLFPPKAIPTEREVLRVDDLTSATGAFHDVGFSVCAGEVLGIAGVISPGSTELVRAIVAAHRVAAGRIFLDGAQLRLRHPADAIEAGIVLVPEDRDGQGLILQHSVSDNLALGNLDRLAPAGWLWPSAPRRFASRLVERFGIRCDPARPARYMSGGNRQKTVIARWVARSPRVLLLDQPTRGVDVGARAAIYRLIADLARGGTAVIIVSADFEECLGLSHRVLVLGRGRAMGILATDDTDAVAIMTLATGDGGCLTPPGAASGAMRAAAVRRTA